MNNFSGQDQVITFSLDGLFTNYSTSMLSGDWDLTAFSFEKGFEAMLDAARLSNGLLDMPLLMLWRQSIELSLKSALYTLPPSQNCPEDKLNHDLFTIFKKIICRLQQIDKNAEDDLSEEVKAVMEETQEIDPFATRFRYPSDKEGTPFEGLHVDYDKLRDAHEIVKGWADGIAVEFENHRPRMTVLAMYAQHGSCSYGEISAARLRSILHGDTPTDAERVRFEQAMLEMPADSVSDLAAEIGVTAAEIEKRTIALCGHAPGVIW